jgi:hypothetical protein
MNVYDSLLGRFGTAAGAARFLGNPSHNHPCPLAGMMRQVTDEELAALDALIGAVDATGLGVFARTPGYLGALPPPVQRFFIRFFGLAPPDPMRGDYPDSGVRSKRQLEDGIRNADVEAFATVRDAVDAEKAMRAAR